MTKQWAYLVVKVQRGINGRWFDYPGVGFTEAGDAIAYARECAGEQRGVGGTRIVVRSRRRFAGEVGWTNLVAEFYS
jgi:hypothetical protein